MGAASPYSRGFVATLLDAWPELGEGWHPRQGQSAGYRGPHSAKAPWEIGAIYKADLERAVSLLSQDVRGMVYKRFLFRQRVPYLLSGLVDAVWRAINGGEG